MATPVRTDQNMLDYGTIVNGFQIQQSVMSGTEIRFFAPSFICILFDNARKKYPVQTGGDLLFLSNAVFTDAGGFVRRGDFHFRVACRSGAPPSPLGPRDQLHRQGHQGPPGLWLRLWEGGPPQVRGHQDRTVGKCLSTRGRANRRGRFTHIRVFVSRSRRSRSS